MLTASSTLVGTLEWGWALGSSSLPVGQFDVHRTGHFAHGDVFVCHTINNRTIVRSQPDSSLVRVLNGDVEEADIFEVAGRLRAEMDAKTIR